MDRIPSLLKAPRETLDTLTVPEPVKMGGAEFPIWLVADEDYNSFTRIVRSFYDLPGPGR